MKFSVLMSVYGKDDISFFADALRSVTIDQTVKPTQVVVVEDGPVDSAIDEIINTLANQCPQIEFTILPKEKNEGLAAALNDGIDLCKYNWIARMDSDDISVKDRFEKQILFIKEHNSVDVIGGAIAEFINKPGDIDSERHVGLSNDAIKNMAKHRTPMNHVSVMYRRDTIASIGGYCENFGKLEDYKLWVDLLSNNIEMANLDSVLVHVRIGNGFISRRSNKSEINDWDMLQEYLVENGMINSLTKYKNRLYIRCFIYMPGWMKTVAYKLLFRK